MAALVDCPACQEGDHSGHVLQWDSAPPGVFGGRICPCLGHCKLTKVVLVPVDEKEDTWDHNPSSCECCKWNDDE